jgi:uracil-DNA glycosylase
MLVGECPSARGDRYWRFPLSGAPARVLCTCAGIPPQTEPGQKTRIGDWFWALGEHFDPVNLFPRHQTVWPRAGAVQNARGMIESIKDAEQRVVVLLGRRVQEAFAEVLDGDCPEEWAWGEWRMFAWHLGPRGAAGLETHIVPLPHPSGLNRLMNQEEIRKLVGERLREAIEKAKT